MAEMTSGRVWQPPRRVLMIAAAFPPTGGAGVQRSAKFAKYLPRAGWSPIVWTSRRTPGLPEDASLLSDLPSDVVIHRWDRGLSARRWQQRLREVGGGTSPLARLARAADWRVERWLAHRAWPDDHVAWAETSVSPLARLIERDAVDVVYSTYSPVSNHVLALEMRTRTARPWIADFRDLWTDECRYREPSDERRRADRALEQRILETADAVIGVSARQTEVLAEHVPGRRDKFFTITNGFDPDDFEAVSARRDGTLAPPSGRFVLAFVGRFDRYRINDAVLDGFRRFAGALDRYAGRFVFRIVGQVTKEARDRVGGTGLPCEFVGPVSHAEAIREMVAADALLVSGDDAGPHAGSVIAGKMFEYLAAGRPIVCVGPRDGEGERLVRSAGAGVTVACEAVAIEGAMRTVYEAWRAGDPLRGGVPGRLEPFSRAKLAKRLADLLDRLVDGARTSAKRRERESGSVVVSP